MSRPPTWRTSGPPRRLRAKGPHCPEHLWRTPEELCPECRADHDFAENLRKRDHDRVRRQIDRLLAGAKEDG